MNNKLSVVLATRNEEANIERCLNSVKDIADEMIVVDEYSEDRTREIAQKFGAKVFLEPHHDIFHITKQKALERATGDWILQLDADEAVTPELSEQIKATVGGNPPKVENKLFERHQKLLERRDGAIGTSSGEIVAYFLPRRNMFLGRPLIHAGVYPDGEIRLVKKGHARFPQKSVHEQIDVDGKVGWLGGDLMHYDSPTLSRYLSRNNRYTDLIAKEMAQDNVKKNVWSFILFVIFKPIFTFFSLFFRHLGILDGPRGFLWSFFSSVRFAIAYFKYLTGTH
jgi:glycosyltransferase involved in cell wall biosynthesis